MPDKLNSEFCSLCRKAGWKCTPQRFSVYKFLKDNLSHPDVDSVWSAVKKVHPSITRESVYRILNEQAEFGTIRRLDHIDNARYDSRTEAHGHFICSKCGKIYDFDWPEGQDLPEEMISGNITHMEIRLIGICKKCVSAFASPVLHLNDKKPENNYVPDGTNIKHQAQKPGKGKHHEKHHKN